MDDQQPYAALSTIEITPLPQERVLMAMRRIIRAVDVYSRRLRSEHDMTGPQLVCLLTLSNGGTLTLSQLSRAVHLSASTLVGILDRLEAKGLISRERDKVDRRVVKLTITDKGRQAAASSPSPLQSNFATRLLSLPVQEQHAIADSLERVVELMEASHMEALPVLGVMPFPSSATQTEP